MGVINVWWLVMYLCAGSNCGIDPGLPPRLEYVRAWCEEDVRRRMALYASLGAESAHRGDCIPDTLALAKAERPFAPTYDLVPPTVNRLGNVHLGAPSSR